jgi:uncharacterized membrane protein SirB2
MSLRGFHILFITLSILLALLCAVWAFDNSIDKRVGFSSVAAAVGLLIYGVWFLKKTKNIIV